MVKIVFPLTVEQTGGFFLTFFYVFFENVKTFVPVWSTIEGNQFWPNFDIVWQIRDPRIGVSYVARQCITLPP